MLELNKLHNMDCLIGMREFPDNYFDLLVTDPPYGSGGANTWEHKPRSRFGGRFDRYELGPTNAIERRGGDWVAKYGNEINHWDVAPSKEYFDEMFRISKNQIIWGGNYFGLPPCRCFLVWRKLSISENFSMAMCEYAWTSFNDNAKLFECTPQGTVKDPRFHPTQKPLKLMNWILGKYAKPGDKIIDPYAGSASTLIACQDKNLDYIGFEINEHYYNLACKRLAEEQAQVRMKL